MYVDPATGSHMPLRDHILLTMRQIEGHAATVGATQAIGLLRRSVEQADNDARWLRERQGEERLLAEVIRQAAKRFRGELTHMQRN